MIFLSLAKRGQAAIKFDFMDKPAAFDSEETQRLIDKIDIDKIGSGAQEIKNKIEETHPGITEKTTSGLKQAQEWFINEAGIDIKNILISIWHTGALACRWIFDFIKGLL